MKTQLYNQMISPETVPLLCPPSTPYPEIYVYIGRGITPSRSIILPARCSMTPLYGSSDTEQTIEDLSNSVIPIGNTHW